MDDSLFTFNNQILNINPSKPFNIPKTRDSMKYPMDILKDEYLMNLFKTLEVPKEEKVFFMPDYVLLSLISANK